MRIVATTAVLAFALSGCGATGTIAYKCADSLCLERPGGSASRKLISAARPWPQWDPAFSPDGQMVAFRGYYDPSKDGAYALYVVQTDGCRVRRLTPTAAGSPTWSPDGRWIAFDRSGWGEIWKVHPDGTGLERLVAGRAAAPSWSPDGKQIAFLRHGELWVMRADGTHAQLLHADAPDIVGAPAWSHDGTRIAFAVQRWPSAWLKVMHADGSGVRQLTTQHAESWNPVWLTNGRIAFLSGANGRGRVLTMRADGSDVQTTSLRTLQYAQTSARLPDAGC
jgi:Tol biopolymer transport system component